MANEQEILVNFIGSNYGLMKQLDDQIIGSSSTLQRRSEDVKKALSDVVKIGTNQHSQHVPQVQAQTQPTVVNNAPPDDDGQLWLTFEDRDKIYDTLDDFREILNNILKKLEKLETSYNITRKRGI